MENMENMSCETFDAENIESLINASEHYAQVIVIEAEMYELTDIKPERVILYKHIHLLALTAISYARAFLELVRIEEDCNNNRLIAEAIRETILAYVNVRDVCNEHNIFKLLPRVCEHIIERLTAEVDGL